MRLSRKDLVPVLAIVAGGAISAVLSFSLLGPSLTGVGSVAGQITDAQAGAPIAATQVFITSLDRGALSRQDGRYMIMNVPPGTYTLTIARIGYRTTHERITVGGGQTREQNFALYEEPLTLSQFIARATAAARQGAYRPGRFVKAMEERERVTTPAELFQPIEVRAIRQR
jgi:hypothetical protein